MASQDEFRYEMRIPRDRIGVLVGPGGQIKRLIEREAKVRLEIDSKEGEVTISSDDGLNIFIAKEVVRAISRGFNPDLALLLLKPDYAFEAISLIDMIRNKNDLERIKGRVIGEEGKARRVIEDLTGAHISIYGKTIGILGEIEQVTTARRAIEMLVEGSPHRNVYKFLERQHKVQARNEMIGKE